VLYNTDLEGLSADMERERVKWTRRGLHTGEEDVGPGRIAL